MSHRHRSLMLILSGALVALEAAPTDAAILRVPGDHSTIQGAIEGAGDGDLVLVAPGTYYEHLDFLGKAITVKSEAGSAATVIDGQGSGHVVRFGSNEGRDSLLEGFVIRNGREWNGAGVQIERASPTLRSNVIRDNQGCSGVGIDVYFGSPLIEGNHIVGNVLNGCSGGMGGGIALGGSAHAEVRSNLIADNMSDSGGGISLGSAGTPIIQNNVIVRNTARQLDGGGINTFNSTDALIVGNLIANNRTARRSGGGLHSSVPYGERGPLLVNNTIVDNESAPGGSQVFLNGFTGRVTLVNNLVVAKPGQTAVTCDSYSGERPAFQANDVFADPGAAYGGICEDETGRNGNVSVDPGFLDRAATDYRLAPGSPVLDAGVLRPELPPHDLDGPRVTDGNGDGVLAVDLGADELNVPEAPVLVSPSGRTADPTPTFRWRSVPTATSYVLTVRAGIKFFRREVGIDACAQGICSAAPFRLQEGRYRWHVTGRNAVGEGPASPDFDLVIVQ